MKDNEGIPIGMSNTKPILDTTVYEEDYEVRYKQALTADVISDNIFS